MITAALGGKERIVLVYEIRKADGIGRGVVECDIKIGGGHELAHDAMNLAIEIVQRRGGMGGLRDAIGGDLDLLRPCVICRIAGGLPARPVGATSGLDTAGVTGAIVGARTPEQVDGWIGAAAIALTPEDLEEIGAAIGRARAGAGPVRAEEPSRRKVAPGAGRHLNSGHGGRAR